MFTQIAEFAALALCLLTLNRLVLALWLRSRVQAAGGWSHIFLWGLRIDLNQLAMWVGIPLLLAPWLDDHPLALLFTGLWLQLVWLLFVFMEAATLPFIREYDTRPNYLFLNYLKYPKEVFGMLWKGYKGALAASGGAMVAAAWVGHIAFNDVTPSVPLAWYWDVLLTLLFAGAIFLAIRGTLGHRPINPASVAWCGDGLLNTLPLNSLYSVLFALYAKKNERSAADAYGGLPTETMLAEVCRVALIDPGPDDRPTLHAQIASVPAERPRNIVIILEESLGAQYVGNLGGTDCTPHLDRLAGLGWNFTRAYATGTRSVRGLEAVAAGFPPTLSDAAPRLAEAQSDFFTLAQLYRQQGYRSRFIYGGEAHFDNMKNFFLGNGFDELYDLPTFSSPAFVGTWGASDEDMFDQLHALLSREETQPTLHLAFTVSNHSPWEYPAGRIAPQGDAASVFNTVRYADWAIGHFFERAQASAYWNDTVFLVVADHDSRVWGPTPVPLAHFRIPALILGGCVVPRRDDRIISQIDLPTTLLSLAGFSATHPMIGHDLTRPGTGGRAMMQYEERYGYLCGDDLLVLQPGRGASHFLYAAPDTYVAQPESDPGLARTALAHVLWPHWAYRHHAHSIP
ncbi:LTA synthase family protein [Castellaniella sp.]|uniref:LTA synthase family protein n=1 Tax=Castellaniella sp. TaxID=1955812 RepID=UPI00356A453A